MFVQEESINLRIMQNNFFFMNMEIVTNFEVVKLG